MVRGLDFMHDVRVQILFIITDFFFFKKKGFLTNDTSKLNFFVNPSKLNQLTREPPMLL